jgi:hypothetical protein
MDKHSNLCVRNYTAKVIFFKTLTLINAVLNTQLSLFEENRLLVLSIDRNRHFKFKKHFLINYNEM